MNRQSIPLIILLMAGLALPAWGNSKPMPVSSSKLPAADASLTALLQSRLTPVRQYPLQTFKIPQHRQLVRTRPSQPVSVGYIYRPIQELPSSGHDYLRAYYHRY